MANHVQWHVLHPYQRRLEHKRLMREAARRVRDSIFRHGAHDNDSKLLIFRSNARAAWRDDIKLAERLVASSPLAAEHLMITSNSVSLSNPSDFAEAFAAEQNIYSERRPADLDRRAQAAPPDGASFKHSIAMRRATRRRAALWTPFKRTFKLQGLRLPDSGGSHDLGQGVERIVNAQADVFEEFRKHWSPIFQRDLPEHPLVRRYLDEHPV
eukprot:8687400-Pyramimonas_sp.AAC.1